MTDPKIIDKLLSMEAFAEMLRQECYSVRLALKPESVDSPVISKKKNLKLKINQVIANRNKSIARKTQ